jgi:hypothetical protein
MYYSGQYNWLFYLIVLVGIVFVILYGRKR